MPLCVKASGFTEENFDRDVVMTSIDIYGKLVTINLFLNCRHMCSIADITNILTT